MTGARDRYTLLYDGHCAFCRASRDLLVKWDRQGKLEPLSFQDPGVLDAFPQITYEQAMESLHVVTPDGRVYREDGVVRVLLRFAPLYLRWLSIFFYLPGVPWVVRRLYRVVAANRYRLSGAPACTDACELHLGKRPKKKAQGEAVGTDARSSGIDRKLG